MWTSENCPWTPQERDTAAICHLYGTLCIWHFAFRKFVCSYYPTITAAAANALIIVVLSCRCCMGTLHTQDKCTCKFAAHCVYLCTEPGSCSLCSRLWWFAVWRWNVAHPARSCHLLPLPYPVLHVIRYFLFPPTLWGGLRAGLRRRRARVQIAAATLSGNSLRQTVHTHRVSVHQAAKLSDCQEPGSSPEPYAR